MALSRIFDVAGQAATAGTTATPTTTAIAAVGDLCVFVLYVRNKSSTAPTIAPAIVSAHFAGGITWYGPFDHSTDAMRVWFGLGVVTTQIPASTNVQFSWTTSATGRYASMTCFRDPDGFNTLVPDEIWGPLEQAATTAIAAGNLTPLSATGLGFTIFTRDNNVGTNPTVAGWTEIRDAGNTAPMRLVTQESFRTTGAEYAAGGASWTGAADALVVAFHLKTGAAATTYPVTVNLTAGSSVAVVRTASRRVTALATSAVSRLLEARRRAAVSASSAVTLVRQARRTFGVTAGSSVARVVQARRTPATIAAPSSTSRIIRPELRRTVSSSTTVTTSRRPAVSRTITSSSVVSRLLEARRRPAAAPAGTAVTTLAAKVILVTVTVPVAAAVTVRRSVGRIVALTAGTAVTAARTARVAILALSASAVSRIVQAQTRRTVSSSTTVSTSRRPAITRTAASSTTVSRLLEARRSFLAAAAVAVTATGANIGGGVTTHFRTVDVAVSSAVTRSILASRRSTVTAATAVTRRVAAARTVTASASTVVTRRLAAGVQLALEAASTVDTMREARRRVTLAAGVLVHVLRHLPGTAPFPPGTHSTTRPRQGSGVPHEGLEPAGPFGRLRGAIRGRLRRI